MIVVLCRYCFIGMFMLIGITKESKGQSSKTPEPEKPQWLDVRIGFVGDLQGSGISFPGLSIGVGANYNPKKILYSTRLQFNKEIGEIADAPPKTYVWDFGLLIGKYFSGGSKRKITLLAGPAIVWGSEYISTGPYMSEEQKFTTVGLLLEAKIFWTYNKAGWGFSGIANINNNIHYFGGQLYIPIGRF